MFKKLRADIAAAKENDPAARSKFEVWLTYSGVHALSWHRWANFLYRHHLKLLARITSQLARRLTGIEIHPAAKIAPGVFIDHGMGVVIGETAEVGKGTVIYQGVTLGGTGKETGKRHPTVGEYCVISSGVKVLGNIYIGDYAKLGAGAVVLKDVPPHATVVGVPGKVVRIRGSKEGLDLLQETSDPVSTEVCRLRERSFNLEAQLAALAKELEETRSALHTEASMYEGTEKMYMMYNALMQDNETLSARCAADEERISSLESALSSLAKDKERQDALSAEQQDVISRLGAENMTLKKELALMQQELDERPAEAEPAPAVAADGTISAEDLMAVNKALREQLEQYTARIAAREMRREERRQRRAAAQDVQPAPAEEPAADDSVVHVQQTNNAYLARQHVRREQTLPVPPQDEKTEE